MAMKHNITHLGGAIYNACLWEFSWKIWSWK